jgi:hypothetical protein
MNDTAEETAEGETSAPKKDSEQVSSWLKELSHAEKREKTWRKEALTIVKLYEGEQSTQSPYNILYSNTETLSPALYNTIPRPVVRTRFKTDDALGQLAARVGQRLLEFLLDTGNPDDTPFDSILKGCVLEALVPGRGVSRFGYEAEIEEPGGEEEEFYDEVPPEAMPQVTEEEICATAVSWDAFLHGYAKRWQDVPWCAYQHAMTREELVENFGDIGKRVTVTASDEDSSGEKSTVETVRASDADGAKLATVWEIWDKTSRTVIFIATSYKDAPLKVVEDPLQLQGFFPSPEPMRFFATLRGMTPVPLYKLYQEQAEELNIVTKRIRTLVKALKVRGFYDAGIADLAKLLECDDNTMLPAENMASLFGQGQSASNAVWILPLNELINALQQLYTQRTQIKSIIFELTGIADIMRGSSQASETLGAQEIKNQWGTLRLKRMQKEVSRYCRDSLRIMLELAVTKMSEETIRKMTGLKFPTTEEKAQAQMAVQQAQMTGQPPDPEQAKLVGAPTWTEILALLKDDIQRNFRIDIETNSTVDAEATEDKKDITELLAAMSQFLLGVGPMVKDGTLPFEAAKAILVTITRRFRMGDDVEDSLKAMQAPKPEADPNAGKAQADAARLQAQGAADKAKYDLEMAALQADMQAKERLATIVERTANLEAQLKEKEFAMRMAEIDRKGQLSLQQHQMAMQTASLPPKPAAQPKAR